MSEPASRRVALITGASSGIGRSFAEEYAKRGVDLVIVARRPEPLDALAARLRSDHKVNVTVLPVDLSDPETPQRLFDALSERSIEVDLLVNNARSNNNCPTK